MSETSWDSIKRERTTDMLCRTVAKGISEIVRFSVDEDFRKRSFTILRVSSTSEMEKKLHERLLASTMKSTSVNWFSSDEEDKDSEPFLNQINPEEASTTKDLSTFDERGQKSSEMYNKNWLKMSIQKKQKYNTVRKSYSIENQDLKHHELFPNHSQNYAANTQNWDNTWYL